MNAPTPSTAEIRALRGLDRAIDARFVAWAADTLAAGHDSANLAVLAGESEPFHHFEMAALVDRTLGDLGVAPHATAEDAARALATVRVGQLLDGSRTREDVLAELAQLSVDAGHLPDLHDFYLLHFARKDLAAHGNQSYWPGEDRDLEQAIEERCRAWLRDGGGG